jgi:hypothetical protein
MAKHCPIAQSDLFEEPPQGMRLGAAERAKALEQLQLLLTEAMVSPDRRREAGDDKDHA